MQSQNRQGVKFSTSPETGGQARWDRGAHTGLNLRMRSTRVQGILREKAAKSPHLLFFVVRNPSSSEPKRDVFTLEDWAPLYK